MTTCITMDNKCYCTRALNTFATGGKMKEDDDKNTISLYQDEPQFFYLSNPQDLNSWSFDFDSWFAPIEKYIEGSL